MLNWSTFNRRLISGSVSNYFVTQKNNVSKDEMGFIFFIAKKTVNIHEVDQQTKLCHIKIRKEKFCFLVLLICFKENVLLKKPTNELKYCPNTPEYLKQ